MLVLSRQLHQRIVLPTIPATIEVVALKARVVRLGIEAPIEAPVFREEMLRRDSIPTGDLLALPEGEAEAQLGRIKRALRYRLHILVLKFDRIRKRVGEREDPELQAMLHSLEAEMRLGEEQLALLSSPAEESSATGAQVHF